MTSARVALREGDLLAGAATIKNSGSGKARASTADIAWNSSATAGTVQVGRFHVAALAAGQQTKQRFRVRVPKDTKAGKYVVSVCVDVLGQVPGHTKGKSKCRSAGAITVAVSGVKGYGPTGPGPSPPSGSGGSSPPIVSAPPSSPPKTFIDSAPTGPIGQSNVTFTFHGSDTNDTFQCSLDGAPWTTCTSPQQYTGLAEGPHTFQVRAVNTADEADPTPAGAPFAVEATPPQTTITSAPRGRVPIGTVSISFSSSEEGSTFRCSLDKGPFQGCSSPYKIESPDAGPHTFTVEATNQAGVAGPAAASASWASIEAEHKLCGNLTASTTIGPEYAERYVITCNVDIPEGKTLTIAPGAVVKASGGSDPNVYGIYSALQVEGTLDAVGTESEPITFTSVNDNSVGGTTGSGDPKPGEWDGIAVPPGRGSLDLEHANISYATTGVLAVDAGGAVVVKDNAFAFSQNSAAGIENVASPTLEANTSSGSGEGVPAFAVESNSLDAGLLGGNSATGSGVHVVELAGTLGTSSTLPAEQVPWEVGTFYTQGGSYPSPLLVPEGKTLTIAPGAVVKASGGSDPNVYGIYSALQVEGTLDAVGTESEPITFTSVNDNSVGGTTGSGDPKPGEWDGIAVPPGRGSLDLEHANISYAETAVDDSSGIVTFRGSLTEDTMGIRGCDWGTEGCTVDAAYSYWGSSEGPFPSGKTALACGAVTTGPYLTSPSSSSTAEGSDFASRNCDGSPTPAEQFATGQRAYGERVSKEEIRCGEGFKEACEVIKETEECLGAATTLAEQSADFKFSDGAKDVASNGADWLASSENRVISDAGQAAGFALDIVGAAKTILDIAEAYRHCG